MILILNGSPNKESTTMTITHKLIEDLKQETLIVNTYGLNVTSCDDCKYCSTKVGCKYSDDMDKIYKYLLKTDTLIISSPIYFGSLSDKLMKVINRFQRYYSQRFDLKDPNVPNIQNLILITTQGSFKKKMFKGAALTYDILMALFNTQNNFKIQAIKSDEIKPLEFKKIRSKIKKVQKYL